MGSISNGLDAIGQLVQLVLLIMPNLLTSSL